VKGSSSSSSFGSSSSGGGLNVVYGPSIPYQGEVYETVVIGNQTWFKRNLNVVPTGENEAVTNSVCYDNDPANCDIYGRLYDWPTAMALPDICVSNKCAYLVGVEHKGICPSGWHIPSEKDWDELFKYADPDPSSYIYASTVGIYLKATSGWDDYGRESGNGEDRYGFSALPGGSGWASGGFNNIGTYGSWWSTSEWNNTLHAYARAMKNENNVGMIGEYDKDILVSVRCLKDNLSSSSVVPSSSSYSGTSVSYGGETYETVVIGTQTWFKRNLNYGAEGSKCFHNLERNCATYGRLYDWATAMALPNCGKGTSCASQIDAKHRGICPSGWHIPSNEDWDKLIHYVDGTSGTISPYESTTAGMKLKAASGWNDCGPVGSGHKYVCEDAFGFSALPGGAGYLGSDYFSASTSAGDNGRWWSSSERSSDYAYHREMIYYNDGVYYNDLGKGGLYSVRCLKD